MQKSHKKSLTVLIYFFFFLRNERGGKHDQQGKRRRNHLNNITRKMDNPCMPRGHWRFYTLNRYTPSLSTSSSCLHLHHWSFMLTYRKASLRHGNNVPAKFLIVNCWLLENMSNAMDFIRLYKFLFWLYAITVTLTSSQQPKRQSSWSEFPMSVFFFFF